MSLIPEPVEAPTIQKTGVRRLFEKSSELDPHGWAYPRIAGLQPGNADRQGPEVSQSCLEVTGIRKIRLIYKAYTQ